MAEISKIKLPSGNVYDIKDAVARQMISGGVSFLVAWDGTSIPDVTQIPAGVQVVYNGTTYTGTLDADEAQAGAFYLVKSSTVTSESPLDVYDEYVPVGQGSEKSWEKIGDTQVDLSNVVTNVSLSKQTANVIGTNATFNTDTVLGTDTEFEVIEPTITVTPTTTYVKASASGANTAWNSKDSVTAVTGFNSKDQVTAVTGFNSKDQKTVVTGYAAPTSDSAIGADATFTTDTFVKSVSAETGKNLVTTSIIPAGSTEVDAITSITDNTQKLATTTVIGVGSTTTTASKATAGTSQTTADGTGTVSTTNTDWLKDISVTDEVLWIKAATMDTQTTTQYTFSDVTVPIKNNSSTTVATGSLTTSGSGANVMTSTSPSTTKVATKGTSTTVATGATSTTGTGDAVVTGVTVGSSAAAVTGWDNKDAVTALTGLGSPSTANVIGSSATFTTDTAVGTNATFTTDTVIGTDATFTVTQPTITLATDASSATGRVQVATGINSASASGTEVNPLPTDQVTVVTGWNSKDQKTVLTNATSLNVTWGGDNAQGVGDSEF